MSGTETPQQGRCHRTLNDQPGPLQDAHDCHHRGQLPQDPPLAFTRECDVEAVFAVPHPSGLGQCLALCPWHLARYLDAYPEEANNLRTHFDVNAFEPETVWLTLDDLPPQTTITGEPDRWTLIALDQRGHAYYADDLDAVSAVAVYAPGHWEHYDEYVSVPEGASTRDVCDHIADVHGLAEIPDDVRQRCATTNGGDA